MIFGCICSKCMKWHSHVSKNKEGHYICINCKNKKGVTGDGCKKLFYKGYDIHSI